MTPSTRTTISLIAAGLAFSPLLFQRITEPAAPGFAIQSACQNKELAGTTAKPFYRKANVHQQGITKQAHASALTEPGNGNLLAAWYGGSREGSKDSAIFTAFYNAATGQWGPDRVIANRLTTGKATQRYVKKVGNPVIVRSKDNTLHLFYVSVSVGGWSGSSINTMQSTDNGESWSTAKRLITSPFFNLSTLVKGEPLFMQDGTIAIPVYHEMMGKFAEMIYYHPGSGVINKTRISHGRASLQPSVVAFDEHNAVALLRYAGKGKPRVQYSRTDDAGNSWTKMEPTTLPNPNAAVSARCIDANTLLMAFNNKEHGRDDLSLAVSSDKGTTWHVIHKIEYAPNSKSEQRFSYPYLIEDSNGVFHISYTWNKKLIKHVSFNRAWLKRKML
ncbi:MAG: exo-alpha-sialidase [Proteobacteria bacterium]|nr:exo-alpha-sialidase [Pseudomonadota bacterium]